MEFVDFVEMICGPLPEWKKEYIKSVEKTIKRKRSAIKTCKDDDKRQALKQSLNNIYGTKATNIFIDENVEEKSMSNDVVFQKNADGAPAGKKCRRSSCQFYDKTKDNNCVALSSVYKDVYQCAFFKKRG